MRLIHDLGQLCLPNCIRVILSLNFTSQNRYVAQCSTPFPLMMSLAKNSLAYKQSGSQLLPCCPRLKNGIPLGRFWYFLITRSWPQNMHKYREIPLQKYACTGDFHRTEKHRWTGKNHDDQILRYFLKRRLSLAELEMFA